MSKKGVSAVSGVITPIIGEEYTYKIVSWYPDTPDSRRDPAKVTWELFRKRNSGKFTTTTIKKTGISSFTFGETALGNTYRLEGYLDHPEGGGLIIKPKTDKIPRITKVELFYVDDSKGSTFSFREKLRTKADCVNMFNKELIFTLWEDDAKNPGHNKNNKPIATKTKKVDKNGVAVVEFTLIETLMQKALQGETDVKQLEFYVTVEYYANKKHASENVDVDNPFYKVQPAKAKGTATKDKEPTKTENNGVSMSNINKPKKDEEKGKCPNCEKEITIDEINKVLGDSEDQNYRKKIVSLLNEYINKRKGTAKELHINTCLRKAHFLSEIATETSLLEKKLTEGNTPPYYSENNIKSLWPGKYKELVKSGKLSTVASERPQKQLLNIVYGHKNGNKGGDDGWNYRGKGLIQLTGRTNYKNASDFLNKVFPEDYVDLEANYDKVAEMKYAVLSSIAFWEGKSIYSIADTSKTKESVPNVRFLVNSYDKDNARTKKYFENAIDAFKVDECKKDKVDKKKSNSKVKLDFVGKTAKESALSEKTKNILREVGEASDNFYIAITSTARTPYDQARIMYENCKSDLAEQRRTYAPPGQKVIDIYVNNKTKPREAVIKLMEQKINELGPSTVSKHLANPEILNTFDIAYGNLKDKTKFWNEMKKRTELDDMLKENNCYHIQIKQK